MEHRRSLETPLESCPICNGIAITWRRRSPYPEWSSRSMQQTSYCYKKTKLGLEDPTPLLEGFDAIRTDSKGNGTHTRRGGGLITYIKKGLQYLVPQCPAVNPLEQQCILLPTSSRRSISITNVYPTGELNAHERPFKTRCQSSISSCGDFNAHHIYQ